MLHGHQKVSHRDSCRSILFKTLRVELLFGINGYWRQYSNRKCSEVKAWRARVICGCDTSSISTVSWRKYLASHVLCFGILLHKLPGHYRSGTVHWNYAEQALELLKMIRLYFSLWLFLCIPLFSRCPVTTAHSFNVTRPCSSLIEVVVYSISLYRWCVFSNHQQTECLGEEA